MIDFRNQYRLIETFSKRTGRPVPWAQVRYWWFPFVWVTLADEGTVDMQKLEDLCRAHAAARVVRVIKDLGKLP